MQQTWGMLRGLAGACHPEPALAVTVAATALALLVGRGLPAAALVAATVLASQLCVGWSNDWLDAGRDATVGRADKPIAAGAVSRRTVGMAALLAGLATVVLAPLSGPVPGLVMIIALASGLAYNWPLKFTSASALPYLISFGGLAWFVARRPIWWLVLPAALLGAGAHFVNVLPDLADDARTGVRGLPHRLGRTNSGLVAGGLLLAATALLAFGPPGAPSAAGLAILGVAVVALPIGWARSRRPGSRAAFRSVLLVALADVALLLLSGVRG